MALAMSGFCRDCLADAEGARCTACGSRRLLVHRELYELNIAHLDCDAFYAAIEKRDDPSLLDKPLIIGGGKRGVVSTACYIARISGVRSAMPMFQALKLCPEAVVIRPDIKKYTEVARAVRAAMRALTPLVEPVSLDEAYLDLSGTERLHGTSAARTMARLAKQIEQEIGITVSVGLSYNKFLAKLASDLDKPRGYAVIGRAEAFEFLRSKPISFIRGVGDATAARLARDGITRIAQLQDMAADDLAKRYGKTGWWLANMARAQDARPVDPDAEMKSISGETTFAADIADFETLSHLLWDQAERVSARAKAAQMGGRTITLKLKTARFQTRTRASSLDAPTQLAHRIFEVASPMLAREADGTAFRLIGVGLSQLAPSGDCDPPDLLRDERHAAAERAIDAVRAKFGRTIVTKGRSLPRR
ncbi:MAG: DNA polymerase IV [Alphaproteobacteria bacterium]|nr:DNA polymerase IV [Alphaproteobacteria bacterium]